MPCGWVYWHLWILSGPHGNTLQPVCGGHTDLARMLQGGIPKGNEAENLWETSVILEEVDGVWGLQGFPMAKIQKQGLAFPHQSLVLSQTFQSQAKNLVSFYEQMREFFFPLPPHPTPPFSLVKSYYVMVSGQCCICLRGAQYLRFCLLCCRTMWRV